MKVRRHRLDPPAVRTWRTVAAGRYVMWTLRRTPDIDMVLALVAVIALLVDPVADHKVANLTPIDAGLALLTSLPLLARRRFPLGVLATVVPLLMACLAVFHPNRAAVGVVMLLVFTVGLQGHRTRSLVVGVLMAPIVTASVLITSRKGGAGDVVAYSALVLGALFAGEALRARQALERAISEKAGRERETEAQHRFDEERLGWAHELHDIVGHTLVAINVRAAAAAHVERQRAGSDASTALEEIAKASAEALAELRSTLKDLRTAQNGPAPLHPIQELADLADLVAGVESAGLAVKLELTGVPASLPATIGHAGYRIVQEGLTNVLRHSTAHRACVRVGVQDGVLVVEVVDDGRKRSTGSQPGGHGVQGMKERASALGGTCEAGAPNDAGWRVRARIPLSGQRS